DVAKDPRAAYFEQGRNGMLMRMALESTLVGDELPGYAAWANKEELA
ncbi:MAG: aspartate carbamoyltransferase, partial [Bifidobacterium crudilactis]|nr:aspartate carbamoyltransferase [Bifidobacterium crudilactis]